MLSRLILAALLHVSVTLWAADDWYAALDVHPEATQEEISKAYKRLARKYHPDVTAETDRAAAIEKFKAAVNAYEVLREPAKREAYDRQTGRGRGGRSGSGPTATSGMEKGNGIHTAPAMPEDAKQDRRGFYYTTSDRKDVYFDPKTGFPLDHNYNPKTKSEHSEFFDELMNPRNVGRRRTLIDTANGLKWTSAVKKDFLARARETLRAATTDETFPSNENLRRMKAVFDLPFVRTQFPELATEFLTSHPEYGSTFASEYLLEPAWAADPQFESLWRLSRKGTFADKGRFPLDVFGTFSMRPGPKTGEVKYSEDFRKWYETHEVIEDQVISHEKFKAVAKMIAEEMNAKQVATIAEQMSWLARGQGMKGVLPEVRLIMNTAAFKEAEASAKPGDLTSRMIQQLKDRIAEAQSALPDSRPPLALPAPELRCDLGQLSPSKEREKVPRKKAEPKPRRTPKPLE